jgi:DNA modification methylase
MRPNPNGRNKRTVWKIPTKPFKGAHFAVFPGELVETPIKAGCPVGGVVLDMFFGSGTVGAKAVELGRNYIGIELNEEYIKIANERLREVQVSLEVF